MIYISVPDQNRNLTFVMLVGTALAVFILGNLFYLNISILAATTRVLAVAMAVILIYYSCARIANNLAWGLALTYGLLWMVTYSLQPWLVHLFYILAAMALIDAGRHFRITAPSSLPLILGITTAAITVLFVARAYTSFDLLQRASSGALNQDTLFHASIASMMKTYGITSTGLNGLVTVPYHALSHSLFASISTISGVSVIEVYGIAPWVLFAPMLIFGIVSCTLALDQSKQLNPVLIWGLGCLSLTALPAFLSKFLVVDSYFVSESYLISLTIILAALPLLFKKNLSNPDIALGIALVLLMTYSKASVGSIYVFLWFLRLAFLNTKCTKTETGIFFAIALAFYWTAFDSANSAQTFIKINPLHFINTYSLLATAPKSSFLAHGFGVILFYSLHFIFTWLLLWYFIYHKDGRKSVIRRPVIVYSVGSASIGILIVTILEIPGGSAYYFSNVSMFVALPFILAIMASAPLKKDFKDNNIIIISLACIIALKTPSIIGSVASSFNHAFVDHTNDLVLSLIEARNRSANNVILELENLDSVINPIARCTAQPFLFPAVSERAWTGIIKDNSACEYIYYGYEQYGLPISRSGESSPPELPPGIKLQPWP